MHVLYIEDDLIDQLAFKRIAEKNTVSYVMVKTVEAAVELIQHQNPFDVIISDFYLLDDTAEKLLSQISNQKILLIATPELISTPLGSNQIEFIQKPLTGKIFYIYPQIITLDLKYFHDLVDGDLTFQKELIDIALVSIPQSISNIEAAMQAKNFDQIKFEVHRMKSGMRVFGINILNDLVYLESIALEKEENKLFPLLDVMLQNAHIAVRLIQKEFMELKQV